MGSVGYFSLCLLLGLTLLCCLSDSTQPFGASIWYEVNLSALHEVNINPSSQQNKLLKLIFPYHLTYKINHSY